MKKIILISLLLIIISKIIIDEYYENKIITTFNSEISQIKVVNKETSKEFYIKNENEIKQFIEGLRVDEWKPKYLDLNTYYFHYQVILNDNTIVYFTRGSRGICEINHSIYYIPDDVYFYLKKYDKEY